MKYEELATTEQLESGKSILLPHNIPSYTAICAALTSCNDVLYVGGTGTGKSFVFFALLEGPLVNAKKVLYIAPKDSIFLNLRKYPSFSMYAGRITFVSNSFFQTAEKADWAVREFDAIILDESHHIGAEITGTVLQSILDKIRLDPHKVFIGLTATPVRDNDKVDTTRFFTQTVYGKTTFECIEDGLMPQIEYLICKTDDALTAEEKDLYREKLSITDSHNLLTDIVHKNFKKKWLCYFNTIEEMYSSRQEIESLFPSHRILCISSDNVNSQMEIDTIGKEENVVILSVSMLLEGIHLPNMEGILLFRNVQSLTVFQQIFGRITAIGSKVNPLFIDCTSTATRLLKKLLPAHAHALQASPSSSPHGKRPILRVSLVNKEIFDISKLLIQMEDLRKPTFEFRGIVYPNFTTACRENGIPDINVIYRHINKYGCTKQEALEYYLENGLPDYHFYFDGKQYPNLKTACLEMGINPVSINGIRHKMGCTQEEALRAYLDSERRKKNIIYDGVTYPTLKAACEAAGISYQSAQYKGRELGNPQEAFDYMVKMKDHSIYEVTLFGVSYPSIQQACANLGIKSSQVNKYKRRWNCSLEEAVRYYLDKKEKPHHPTAKETAEAMGVDYIKVAKRKSRAKCSTEDAIRYIMEKECKKITIGDQEFSTVREACTSLHISENVVRYYMKKDGIPIEEAIQFVLKKEAESGFQFRGCRFRSFAEACRVYGTNDANICSSSIYHSISKEEALERFISRTA